MEWMQLHSDQISADACNSLFEVLIMALQTDTMQTDNHADETSEFVGSAEEVPKAMPQPQIVPKTASNLTDMALDIFANVRGLRMVLEISEQACQTMCEVVEEVVNRLVRCSSGDWRGLSAIGGVCGARVIPYSWMAALMTRRRRVVVGGFETCARTQTGCCHQCMRI